MTLTGISNLPRTPFTGRQILCQEFFFPLGPFPFASSWEGPFLLELSGPPLRTGMGLFFSPPGTPFLQKVPPPSFSPQRIGSRFFFSNRMGFLFHPPVNGGFPSSPYLKEKGPPWFVGSGHTAPHTKTSPGKDLPSLLFFSFVTRFLYHMGKLIWDLYVPPL